MVLTDEEIFNLRERKFLEKWIDKNELLSELVKRNQLGYQSAIIINGEPNSGKTVVGNLIKYILTKGYKHEKLSIDDYFFGIRALASKINDIEEKNKIYLNDETSDELSVRNWNSINNTLWNLILSTQRVKKNIYINMLPHIRQMSKPHLILYNYMIKVDNFIVERRGTDNKVLSTEVVRYMDVFKIKVNYSLEDSHGADNFIKLIPFQRYWLPDYTKVKELEGFKKFMESEHKEFELKGKKRIADKISSIANLAEGTELAKNKKMAKEIQASKDLKSFLIDEDEE